MKKRIGMVLVLALALSLPAFAGTVDSAVVIFSDLSGMTVQEAWTLRHDTDRTFGELAVEQGFGDAFSDRIQEVNKERIADFVEQGRLTQEQADEILKNMEECDGTPGDHIRLRDLAGSGYGEGDRNGYGPKDGTGARLGNGAGSRGRMQSGFGGVGFRGGSAQ